MTPAAVALFAATVAVAVAFECPSQCKQMTNPSRRTDCVCSSGNSPVVLNCDDSHDKCFVKCKEQEPLLPAGIGYIGFDLSNVTSLDLECSFEGSYFDLLGGLGADRVQNLRLLATPSGLALTERSFGKLESSPLRTTLTTLILAGDLLKESVSSKALSLLVTLDKLVVEHTRLSYLRNGIFSGLTNLSTLEIAHNEYLAGMESDVFADLPKLSNLVLVDNERLRDLPSKVMYPLENLRTVNFTDLEVRNFSSVFFSRNKQLESISILRDNCPSSCARNFAAGFLPDTATLRTFVYNLADSSSVESAFFSPDFFTFSKNVSVVDMEDVVADLSIISPLENLDSLILLTDEILPLDCEFIPRSLKYLKMNVDCRCQEIACLRRLNRTLISFDVQVDCNGTFVNASEAVNSFCIEDVNNVILTATLLLLSLAALAVGIFVLYKRLHPMIVSNGSARLDYDVFISCVDSDADYAERLIAGLERAHGVRCCYHKRDFSAGFPIHVNIEEKMMQSRRIVLVVSSAFLNSDWCEKEMLEARTQKKAVLVIARRDLLNEKVLQSRQHIYKHIREVTYLQEDHGSFEEQLIEFLRPKP